MPAIVAVCKSQKKGTRKEPVPEIIVKEACGVTGDAHADSQTHRQVSLLAMESIAKMRRLGFERVHNVKGGYVAWKRARRAREARETAR